MASVNIATPVTSVCPICSERYTSNEFTTLHSTPTSHINCTNCFKQYIISKITETDIRKINCCVNNCQLLIPLDVIQHAFQTEYSDLLKKQNTFIVANDPKLMFCPNVNCEAVVSKIDGKEVLTCSECKFIFHVPCLAEYKEGHSCRVVIANIKKELGKEYKHIYKCPTCKYKLIKAEGCNHMSCPFCKHQWCYICGAPFNYHHYSGFFRCFSQYKHISLTMFLLVHYVAILLFPITELPLVVVLEVYFMKFLLDKLSFRDKRGVIFVFILMIIAALLALPVCYVLLAVPLQILMIVRAVIFTKRAVKKRALYIC